MGVDPGEAAAGGDESGRVLSPRLADAESGRHSKPLAVEVDREVHMEVVNRQIVPEAGNAIDHLPFMQLLNGHVHMGGRRR